MLVLCYAGVLGLAVIMRTLITNEVAFQCKLYDTICWSGGFFFCSAVCIPLEIIGCKGNVFE